MTEIFGINVQLDVDNFTSQANQGYSEGLADYKLESEISSIFALDPSVLDLPSNAKANRVLKGPRPKTLETSDSSSLSAKPSE